MGSIRRLEQMLEFDEATIPCSFQGAHIESRDAMFLKAGCHASTRTSKEGNFLSQVQLPDRLVNVDNLLSCGRHAGLVVSSNLAGSSEVKYEA